LATFVWIERRSKAPLVRLGIFRNRSLTGANSAMVLVVSGMFAMFFFATLYVQEVLGYSPLKAGLAFLPVTAGIIAGAGLAQQIGGALGLAILSTVAASHTSSALSGLGHAPTATERTAALVGGWTTGFTVGGVLMVLAATLLMLLIRKRHVAAIVAGEEPAL